MYNKATDIAMQTFSRHTIPISLFVIFVAIPK